MKLRHTLAATLSLALASGAQAQTETIFGVGGAGIMQAGSIFMSIAPQFQSFGLPRYTLGFTSATGATFVDQGAVVTHDERFNAFGATASIGYVFAGPIGPFMHPRIELLGSFVASGSQADSRNSTLQGGTQLVNGAVVDFGCNPCDWQSTLRRTGTHYRFAVMLGGDLPIGPNLVLTPSIGAFGARTQVWDSLFQTFAGPGGTPGPSDFYSAESKTRWWDAGGRVKAVVTWQANDWLSLFIGGHGDLGIRRASFDASDLYGSLSVGSSQSASATRFNFAVGGQVGVNMSYGNWLIVSIIGGADYDHRVPYTRRQSTTDFVSTIGTTQTPASLAFSGEVNYAAQVKVTVKLY